MVRQRCLPEPARAGRRRGGGGHRHPVVHRVLETRHLDRVWASLPAARLISGTVLPMEVVLAFAVGATVGTGLLVAFGAPDLRPGPDQVAAALQAGGFPVVSAELASTDGKGSRPFVVANAEGRRFFVKVLGQDQRDADLLYRAYRSIRLRDVGDVRPAASLKQAVEHQALVGLMAERADVHVPSVRRIVAGPDESVMLVMDFVDGSSLADLTDDELTDALLRQLWREVDHLHRAGIAHRSLRTANVMIDHEPRPWIVDFSFSEVGANSRALELDVAELLASLAAKVGPERAVDSALPEIGAPALAMAVPLLQPLALSAATRRVIAGRRGRRGERRQVAGAHPRRSRSRLGHIARPARARADPARTSSDLDHDRPRRRSVLLHPAATRTGRRQLQGVPVGALGMGSRHHLHVIPDVRRERVRA